MQFKQEALKDLSFIDSINSIAVIGASRKRNFFFVRTFAETFNGKIYAINSKFSDDNKTDIIDIIESLNQNKNNDAEITFYRSINDVPESERVDFAFIAVPREYVNDMITKCALKGVKLISIFTADFADENSEKGKKLQKQLIENIKYLRNIERKRFYVIGPNGMGLYIPKLGIRWRSSLPINTGNLGLVAQSGGLCNLLIHGLNAESMGISKAFSIGNAIDVNFLDVINYFINDDETKIIIGYLEGLSENFMKTTTVNDFRNNNPIGKDLMDLLRHSNKPIVLIKAGRSETGAKAAISHTASLIGDFTIWKSAMKQSGAIMVDSIPDLINVVKLLHFYGDYFQFLRMKHSAPKVAMVSISGGYGVVCADILNEHGLKTPMMSDELKKRILEKTHAHGISLNNPVDVASLVYNPPVLHSIIEEIIHSGEVDSVIFEITPLYLAHQMDKKYDLSVEFAKMLKILHQKYYVERNGANGSGDDSNKIPIFVIIQKIGFNEIELELKNKLQQAGIACFDDILMLSRALSLIFQ